ncbi:uncharacterized protein [Nicotiana sylvestris]|uniref:uncharacterized protein n=1 Tax=Nicotiana sylvestris TaxID=4096 RepID=UPI00388CAB12
MGHNINEYELIPETVQLSILEKEENEVFIERTIRVSEEDILLHKKLDTKQLKAYNVIIDRVFSKKPGAFFIDGGRTAHSRFKIPIDIDENFSCNTSKQSSTASLIRDAKLIVWDEVSMAKKRMLYIFDLLLKDLMDTNILFGEKVVVFGVDFRQTLLVVRSGNKEDFINESLLYSTIWDELEKLQLFENMRAKTDPAFCDYLIRIGNGQERVNFNNKIELPDSMIIPFTTKEESLNHLFAMIFSNNVEISCFFVVASKNLLYPISDVKLSNNRQKRILLSCLPFFFRFLGAFAMLSVSFATAYNLHLLCCA